MPLLDKAIQAAHRFAGYYCATKSFSQAYRLQRLGRRTQEVKSIKLHGRTIFLRDNFIDREVFCATYGDGFHRPPVRLSATPTIVDLGSNIGLTLIDFENFYPGCRLVGVELDPSNYDLLQRNVAQLKNCQTLNAGIWRENGVVFYEDLDAQAFRIVDQPSEKTKSMRSISVSSLFRNFNVGEVDYLKMDIEGAEYEVLHPDADLGWLPQVKLLNVEYHERKGLSSQNQFEQLKRVLDNRGFQVFKSSTHWASFFAFNRISL